MIPDFYLQILGYACLPMKLEAYTRIGILDNGYKLMSNKEELNRAALPVLGRYVLSMPPLRSNDD